MVLCGCESGRSFELNCPKFIIYTHCRIQHRKLTQWMTERMNEGRRKGPKAACLSLQNLSITLGYNLVHTRKNCVFIFSNQFHRCSTRTPYLKTNISGTLGVQRPLCYYSTTVEHVLCVRVYVRSSCNWNLRICSLSRKSWQFSAVDLHVFTISESLCPVAIMSFVLFLR